MEYIDVIYGRSSWKPISLLIQLRTLSRWSHIGAVVGDSVIEAVGGQGVVITKKKDFLSRYTHTAEGKLQVVNRNNALDYLTSKVGAKYDTKAALGYLLLLGWDDIEAMHCSEMLAMSTGLFDLGVANTISPEYLRKLTKWT